MRQSDADTGRRQKWTMSISARRARVISVAQTRVATRLLDIVTLTLITITFTLTPPRPRRSPHPPLRRVLGI